tara:strand:- start:3572 stop:4237 length:666 start_codon:yes stop_codon:yes gene_type:complete
MLKLENITLVILSSIKLDKSIKALEYSSKDIEWGSVKLISDTKPDNLPDFIQHEFCPKMSNIDEWNYAAIYELPKHIETDYCMLIHDDGFVVNADSWRDEFLEYDYIGAPWPMPQDDFSFRAKDGELVRVGNSVSLRSKKLLDLPIKLNLEWKAFHGYYNEDGYICVNYRHKYLENGIKFADIDVAKYFSHESMIPEIEGIKPFAFHRHFGTNAQYPNYGK